MSLYATHRKMSIGFFEKSAAEAAAENQRPRLDCAKSPPPEGERPPVGSALTRPNRQVRLHSIVINSAFGHSCLAGECPFRRAFCVPPPVGRGNTDDYLCGWDNPVWPQGLDEWEFMEYNKSKSLPCAGVAELADAPDLGSGGQPCRFKSCRPHHVYTS